MKSSLKELGTELIGKQVFFILFCLILPIESFDFFFLMVHFFVINDCNRVGIEIPKIEVRYDHLSVEGDVHVGTRALPTLLNVALNMLEVFFSPFPFILGIFVFQFLKFF